jgi:DNA polymerase-3 subunit epsilon
MSWADGRLCGFDIETTGEGREIARIITVTVVLVGAGQPAETLCLLADPGVEIPAGATAVHGVTTERARAEGLKPAEVLETVASRLAEAWKTGPVIGFNIVYDLTVLDRELRRHTGLSLDVSGPVIDPHVIDRAFDRRKGKRTLEETCRYYDVRHDAAHDATQDALAAARLAWRLAKRYPVQVGSLPLAELHAQQIGWAQQWADGLNEYWRSQGQDKSIDGSWPLQPLPK